ncbi:MAG: alkaline phosphatase, partial [Planctomycetia bacterium]|nr:alkaline phosphatase [Planctomycetia bacterium]
MSVSKSHSYTFSLPFPPIFTIILLVFGLLFPLMTGCDAGAKLMEKAQNAVKTSSAMDEDEEKEDEEEYVVIDLNAPKKVENAPNETESDLKSELKSENIAEVEAEKTTKIASESELKPGVKMVPASETSPTRKKNIILMIADGAGFGSFYAAADFMTGSPTGLFYQKSPWKNASVATFHKKSFYEPEADWKEFKNLHIPFYEKEPAFIPPESASTGTAMMTGVKTRNGRIGIGPNDEKLMTIAEIFHKNGYRTGAVTSFQIASATMATVAAHSLERKEGQKMLTDMLRDGNLDVLIGAGHPGYDDDGRAREAIFGKYGPSAELWKEIQSGNLPEYHFLEKRVDFQSLAELTPDKILKMT